MANLGFVGLGVMGSEMVNRLLDKGHTVTGYNRTRSKAQWLIDKGMKWADSPRAVVGGIGRHVFDGHQFGGARRGRERTGWHACRPPGRSKLFVDMSTVSPAVSRALAAKVREKGADMVDAPVSGSVITLQQGKLSVMVGGRKETFERVKPLLLDIGPKVTHVGDNGLALVMKIATNLSLAVQMLAFSRRRAAGRKERHRARNCGGRADAQRDRFADGAISRTVRAEACRTRPGSTST